MESWKYYANVKYREAADVCVSRAVALWIYYLNGAFTSEKKGVFIRIRSAEDELTADAALGVLGTRKVRESQKERYIWR